MNIAYMHACMYIHCSHEYMCIACMHEYVYICEMNEYSRLFFIKWRYVPRKGRKSPTHHPKSLINIYSGTSAFSMSGTAEVEALTHHPPTSSTRHSPIVDTWHHCNLFRRRPTKMILSPEMSGWRHEQTLLEVSQSASPPPAPSTLRIRSVYVMQFIIIPARLSLRDLHKYVILQFQL